MTAIEAQVDQAIKDGRVHPRNRARWIRNIKANASTAQIMARLEPALDSTPFDPITWKL